MIQRSGNSSTYTNVSDYLISKLIACSGALAALCSNVKLLDEKIEAKLHKLEVKLGNIEANLEAKIVNLEKIMKSS